jgi:hypothetical protein
MIDLQIVITEVEHASDVIDRRRVVLDVNLTVGSLEPKQMPLSERVSRDLY